MTLRLRRKHRTTVRVRQLANQVKFATDTALRSALLLTLSIGLMGQTCSAQQQARRSYNPPVHIQPGQNPAASQRYTGIVIPGTPKTAHQRGNTPRHPATSYRGPVPAERHNTIRKSPQLQQRISQALSGMVGRNPRQNHRSSAQNIAPQNAAPQNRAPKYAAAPTPVQPSYATADYNAPQPAENTYGYDRRVPSPHQPSESVRPIAEYSGSNQHEGRVEQRNNPRSNPSSNRQFANKQFVENGNQYATQPIRSQSAIPKHQSVQQLAQEYYDREDVQTTSGRQLEGRFIDELPNQTIAQNDGMIPNERLAQTPVLRQPSFNSPPPQAESISVLNKLPGEAEPYQNNNEYYPEQDQGMEASDPMLLTPSNERRESVNMPIQDTESENRFNQDTQRRSFEKSCDEMRREMLSNPITDIAIDVSPPRSSIRSDYVPEHRTWTDQFGRTIAEGKIQGFRQGYITVRGSQGDVRVPIGNLSDPDLDVVARYWQIPKECTVSQETFTGRHWAHQTVTWKASNLCHKPLYFENIQLERYGHSHGPFAQPIHSTVHFFGSLALLPYQTGINPPNECQYALGFYRPGNCAPWLRDPFPISLAGARKQAASMVGGAFLITP